MHCGTNPGVPTDDEQATGLERRALQALKKGKVLYVVYPPTHTHKIIVHL